MFCCHVNILNNYKTNIIFNLAVRAHSGRSDTTDLCQMAACNQGGKRAKFILDQFGATPAPLKLRELSNYFLPVGIK